MTFLSTFLLFSIPLIKSFTRSLRLLKYARIRLPIVEVRTKRHYELEAIKVNNNGEYSGKLVTRDKKSPSSIAKSWQGSGKYPGIDDYENIILKEGDIIYRGEPNGSEFFTTKEAIKNSVNKATILFEGLQVEKHPIYGYRKNMTGYKVNSKIEVASGIAKANPQFGRGGSQKIFVPDVDELIKNGILIPIDNIKLIE